MPEEATDDREALEQLPAEADEDEGPPDRVGPPPEGSPVDATVVAAPAVAGWGSGAGARTPRERRARHGDSLGMGAGNGGSGFARPQR